MSGEVSPGTCPRCGQATFSRTMEKYAFKGEPPVDADEYYQWVCVNVVNGKECGQTSGRKLNGGPSRDEKYNLPPTPETFTSTYDG